MGTLDEGSGILGVWLRQLAFLLLFTVGVLVIKYYDHLSAGLLECFLWHSRLGVLRGKLQVGLQDCKLGFLP